MSDRLPGGKRMLSRILSVLIGANTEVLSKHWGVKEGGSHWEVYLELKDHIWWWNSRSLGSQRDPNGIHHRHRNRLRNMEKDLPKATSLTWVNPRTLNLFPGNHVSDWLPDSPCPPFKVFLQNYPIRQRRVGFPISMVCIPSSCELRVPLGVESQGWHPQSCINLAPKEHHHFSLVTTLPA